MTDRTVANSACLIILQRIGRLDLLPGLFNSVLIPEAVAKEIGFSASWLEVRAVRDNPLEARLRHQLGAGESAALALAIEVAPSRIILDDRRARRAAEQLGLPIIGTPGVLVLSKRRALLDRVHPVLEAMHKAGFYMSRDLVETTLRAVDELESRDH